MKTFREFLGEKKYYPYRLAPRRPGQKRRSIAGSNSGYKANQQLRRQLQAAKQYRRRLKGNK